jgi:hypothetical protein
MEMLEREAKQATAGIWEDWSGDLERMEVFEFFWGTFGGSFLF